MNRSLISLAATAAVLISSQAFAATPPAIAKLPVGQQPTMAPEPSPAKLTSAKFTPSEVYAGETVTLEFAGVNLGANKSCLTLAVWPANPWAAYNGHWAKLSRPVLDLPGTYVYTFKPVDWKDVESPHAKHPCTSDGPITATLVVKPARVAPEPPHIKPVLLPVTPKALP